LRDLLINIVKRDGIEKKQAVNGVETLLTRRFDHCGFGTDNAVGSSNNFQEVNHNLLVRTPLQQINMHKSNFTGFFDLLHDTPNIADVAVQH